MVAAELPPVRITFAELERRMARKDWVQKRRGKLPRTVAAMEHSAESTDAFRRRRLSWFVAKALKEGTLKPCEVLRAAGLPTGWLEEVRAAIGEAELLERPCRLAA